MRVVTVILIVACILLLQSCSKSESNWKSTQKIDTVSAYQHFITAYPQSQHVKEAKQHIDLLLWKSAVAKNSIVAFNEFIIANPQSQYIVKAKQSIEELQWKEAITLRDKKMLQACIKQYPASKYVTKANEVIWELDWPPVKLTKAASVTIYSKGRGIISGQIMYSMGGMFGGGGGMDPIPGSPAVEIWRDFTPTEQKECGKLGLRTGLAYLQSNNRYQFIRKVDLSKNDKQLCAEFGVDRK